MNPRQARVLIMAVVVLAIATIVIALFSGAVKVLQFGVDFLPVMLAQAFQGNPVAICLTFFFVLFLAGCFVLFARRR